MSKLRTLLLFLVTTCLLSSASSSQTDSPTPASPVEFSYEISQATFLTADSATVFPNEDKVTIQVQNLSPEKQLGLVLTLEGLTEKEIEVTTLIDFNGLTVGLYPPKYVSPNDQGNYIVLGKAGDRFGIRGRTESGIKQIFAEIEGKPEEPDKPPTEPDEPENPLLITEMVQKALVDLDDPVTARYIRQELTKVEYSGNLDQDIQAVKDAIGDGLVLSMKELDPPYKDWQTKFRQPLDKLLTPETSAELEASIKVVIEALGDTTAATRSVNKVVMFTRSGCVRCAEWNRTVRPELEAIGWEIEEIYSSQAVPAFMVCTNRKCSNLITEYLTIPAFNQVVASLRK
jgi:hypothetical protein